MLACKIIEFPAGGRAVVCGPHKRTRPPCAFCDREHTKLCDYPIAAGGRCDRKLCDEHALRVGPNRDYCGTHTGNIELELPL
jgi:hypothetical protein